MGEDCTVHTGYVGLDGLTGGFRHGEVVAVVSRAVPEPGVADSGASDLLMHTVYEAAGAGAHVVVMAAHASEEQIALRMIMEAMHREQGALGSLLFGTGGMEALKALGDSELLGMDVRIIANEGLALGDIVAALDEHAGNARTCLAVVDGAIRLSKESDVLGAALFMGQVKAAAGEHGWAVMVAVEDDGAILDGIERSEDPAALLRERMPELEAACDALLLVLPGEAEVPGDAGEPIESALMWAAPTSSCYVAKSRDGMTGAADLTPPHHGD